MRWIRQTVIRAQPARFHRAICREAEKETGSGIVRAKACVLSARECSLPVGAIHRTEVHLLSCSQAESVFAVQGACEQCIYPHTSGTIPAQLWPGTHCT